MVKVGCPRQELGHVSMSTIALFLKFMGLERSTSPCLSDLFPWSPENGGSDEEKHQDEALGQRQGVRLTCIIPGEGEGKLGPAHIVPVAVILSKVHLKPGFGWSCVDGDISEGDGGGDRKSLNPSQLQTGVTSSTLKLPSGHMVTVERQHPHQRQWSKQGGLYSITHPINAL